MNIRWSNDGILIKIAFNEPTDMGSTVMGTLWRTAINQPNNFDCDRLLQFSTFTVYQLGSGLIHKHSMKSYGSTTKPSSNLRLLLLLGK